MADDEFDLDLADLEKRMDGAYAALRNEFLSLRTGRASASMLEPVMVEAYGALTPINQVATVNVPEPRMLTVNVWDKGMVADVDKAIRNSGLGINPVMDGTVLRDNLKVMDASAIALARDNKLPIVVFNLAGDDSLYNVVNGEGKFTIVRETV